MTKTLSILPSKKHPTFPPVSALSVSLRFKYLVSSPSVPLWFKCFVLSFGLALCLALPIFHVAAQPVTPANNFGVVEGFWLPDDVCELGAGWERIIFDWSQHQPTGPDDWHTLNVDDRWLAAARDCNREVVAIFKHTPAWATDGTAGAGVPRGLYLPIDDPGNLWARFMRRSAEYYAPRGVSRFIIWNEPDITRETYGFEFEGSLDDYFQMLKVAYLALKQGNPAAEILLAGTTYWHDLNAGRRLYLDRLLERITSDTDSAAHGYYFDIVSLHIYFRAETVYDIVQQTRQLLDKYGLGDKRIWINETNAAPTDDPLWPVVRPQYQIDLDQQAAFLVQAAASGLAAGAERIAVYKFYDWNLPPDSEAFGLLRADGSRRPAFDSWALVIREFSGVVKAELARTDKLDVVRLTRADDQQLIVAWARTAESVQLRLSATSAAATLLDQYGHTEVLQPPEGGYTLTLAGAVCNEVDGCAVGGNVRLLLQPDGAGTVEEITSSGALELQFQ
jgi:Glycosyl hydrolase catalytic core